MEARNGTGSPGLAGIVLHSSSIRGCSFTFCAARLALKGFAALPFPRVQPQTRAQGCLQHVWHSQRPGIKSFGSGRGWKSGVSHLGDGAAAPAHGAAHGLGLAQVAQAQEWWQEVRELLWQQLAINKDELECDAASGWK